MTIYPEQELPEGYDPRTRPWYEAAEASGQDVAITNPYVDAASQKNDDHGFEEDFRR